MCFRVVFDNQFASAIPLAEAGRASALRMR